MKNTITVIILFLSPVLIFGQGMSDPRPKKSFWQLEWDNYFMPGGGYRAYIPKNTSKLGIYQGFMAEFVFYAGARRELSRRARIKTYCNLSIMSSNKYQVKDIFLSNVGINSSFEANIRRRYTIPYFGLEIGGLFQKDFSTFQFIPVLGIEIISNQLMIWNIQGGYHYPVKKFDEYKGYILSSTINIAPWNQKSFPPKKRHSEL